jgi:hypothetical protein
MPLRRLSSRPTQGTFPSNVLAKHAIAALTPAAFLADLTQEFPQQMLEIVQDQATALRRPPMTFDALFDTLGEYAPAFAAILREVDARNRAASDRTTAVDVSIGAQSTDVSMMHDD